MSDTLNMLRTILVEQLGIPVTAIDTYCPLQELGMEATDLEEFIFLIEKNYHVDLSVIIEERYETDIDKPERDFKHQNLRQIANWVDGWIDCPESIREFMRGIRNVKLSVCSPSERA